MAFYGFHAFRISLITYLRCDIHKQLFSQPISCMDHWFPMGFRKACSLAGGGQYSKLGSPCGLHSLSPGFSLSSVWPCMQDLSISGFQVFCKPCLLCRIDGRTKLDNFVGLFVIVDFNCYSYYCNACSNKSLRHPVPWMVTQEFDKPGLFFREGIDPLFPTSAPWMVNYYANLFSACVFLIGESRHRAYSGIP